MVQETPAKFDLYQPMFVKIKRRQRIKVKQKQVQTSVLSRFTFCPMPRRRNWFLAILGRNY